MAYPYTRAQLRRRVLVESHTRSDSGAADTTRINEILQYAIAHTWETLTATDQAFAERVLTKTVDAADTDGWTPGASTVALPADFRRVEKLKRGTGYPSLITPADSLDDDAPGAAPGWYYARGPSQDTDSEGALTVAAQELVLSPVMRAGEVFKLLYVQQPPSVGDPDDTADDTVALDLVGDGIARLVVTRAIVLLQARDDTAGQRRAAEEYALARTEYDNARAQRAGGVNSWRRRRRNGS